MIEGSCLCGGVRYRAEQPAGPMAHCHCQQCRKAHGAAFSTILPVEKKGFRWTQGQSRLAYFESSPGKRRWFCGRCGSQLISTRTSDDATLLLRAGCIDRGHGAGGVAHGWVDSMAPWYRIKDELPQFARGFPAAPSSGD